MSFGTKLFNNTGKLAFSTDYKTYVYQEKIFPHEIQVNNVAASAQYCTSPGLTGPIFPFVKTPDNSAAIVFINKYNPLGTTSAYAPSAQTNVTTLSIANSDSYSAAWPNIRVGCTIKTPGGQTATVTSMTGGILGTTNVGLSQAVTVAQFDKIYVVEYIGSYYIVVGLNSTTSTLSSFPMRVFSRNIPNTNSGYGAKMFDTAGTCVFNSNYPVLTLAATLDMPSGTASNMTITAVPVAAGSIPEDYSAFSPPLGYCFFGSSTTIRTSYMGPTRASSTLMQPGQSGLISMGYRPNNSWIFNPSANVMFIDNAKYP